MNAKRKAVEDHIFYVLNSISPNNRNIALYKAMFDKMDDKKFDKWMNDIKDGKTTLYYIQPNGQDAKGDLLNKDRLINTAEKLNIKLEQNIKLWDNVQQRYFTTPYKYKILQLPVRRLKQYLLSKISVPDSDKRINPVTGQVVKPDKASSISMTEAQTIASKGLYNYLTEIINVRGGNIQAYAAFKAELENNGSADLKDLKLPQTEIQTVNVVNSIFKSIHLDINL